MNKNAFKRLALKKAKETNTEISEIVSYRLENCVFSPNSKTHRHYSVIFSDKSFMIYCSNENEIFYHAKFIE